MPYHKNHWLKEAQKKIKTTPNEARDAMEKWFQGGHGVPGSKVTRRIFYDINPQYLEHDLYLEVRNTPEGIKVELKDDWEPAAKLVGMNSISRR